MSLHGNWIKFRGLSPQRDPERHHITINHKGQIHIGRQAHTDLGRPRAVTLYYEPDLHKIAIQCADTRVPGRVPVIPKTNGAYYVPASQFIRQNRIHIAGTEAFIKPELNHNGILILDLTETTRVGRGRRTAAEIE